MGFQLSSSSHHTSLCCLASEWSVICLELIKVTSPLFWEGLISLSMQSTVVRALTLAFAFCSTELFSWRERKLPQHRDSFEEAVGRLSVTKGYRWVKNYNVRPLCSGHGGQLYYSMTTFHLVANDLLNAAVSQVFAFLFRSHIGRLQIALHMHLCEDRAYLISGVGWDGESHGWNRVVQTTRNLFFKLLNVGTSCEECFGWTLFLPLGLVLSLQLVSGIRASEQPCCCYSQSFPPSRVWMVLHVLWNQRRGSRETCSCMWWRQGFCNFISL